MGTGSPDVVNGLVAINDRLAVWTQAVALGGTSLTLHGIKQTTKDVDFIVEEGDMTGFGDVYGTKVDTFGAGQSYTTRMPSDYIRHSAKIMQLEKLFLLAMDPLGVIITKMARGLPRDFEDSAVCVTNKRYTAHHIKTRFDAYGYDAVIERNLNRLMERRCL